MRRQRGNPERDAGFIRLQVDERAKQAMAKAAARHQMSQTELATLLVERLTRMPGVVQTYILNLDNKDAERAIAEHLTRKA